MESLKQLLIKSTCNQLRFVRLEKEHLKCTYKIRNDPRILSNFLNTEKISYDNHCQWFDQYSSDESQLMMAILYGREVIGQFGLYDYDMLNSCVEFGRFFINTKYQNKGFGMIAMLDILSSLKTSKLVSTVYLYVKKNNAKAVRLYTNAGFMIKEDCRSKLHVQCHYMQASL